MILKFKTLNGMCIMDEVFGVEVIDGYFTQKEAEELAAEESKDISFFSGCDNDGYKLITITTKLDYDTQDDNIKDEDSYWAMNGEIYLMNNKGGTIERIN